MKTLQPVLTLQVPGQSGRYESFHRVTADSAMASDLRTALDKIIHDKKGTEIGQKRPSPFTKRPKTQPATREDTIPGVVNATVSRALDQEPAELT